MQKRCSFESQLIGLQQHRAAVYVQVSVLLSLLLCAMQHVNTSRVVLLTVPSPACAWPYRIVSVYCNWLFLIASLGETVVITIEVA